MAPKSAFTGTGRTLSSPAVNWNRPATKINMSASNPDNPTITITSIEDPAPTTDSNINTSSSPVQTLAEIRKAAHEAKKLQDELAAFQASQAQRIDAEAKARVEELRKEYRDESRGAGR